MDIKMTITGITLIKAGIIMIMIGSQAGLTGILQRITTTIIHPSTPTTRHYTQPVYYNMPVVYHNSYIDPWWGANIYGFGSTYYSSSSHWTYKSGFGF